MKTIDYDAKEESANTETLIATDEQMKNKPADLQLAYNEGFAASDGVRGETAETGGRVKMPESGDETYPKRKTGGMSAENPGLADN